jgi:hypothetical protein
MLNQSNPYYLKTLDDFYTLHFDIQEYLKEFFLMPKYQLLIKATPEETVKAFIKDWQEVEEDSLRWDRKDGIQHEPLLPASEAQKSVTGILKLFNSALAILFRSDWEPYQDELFGSWIPIGVRKPTAEQERIQVLNWPTDCFEENTYFCTSESIKVLESGLTFCSESDAYILFWRPEPSTAIPLDKLVRFDLDDCTNCSVNLWEDIQIKNILNA